MVESKMVAVGIVNSVCDGQLFLPQADIIAREVLASGSKPHGVEMTKAPGTLMIQKYQA
jgi:ABC-type cobalamin transport system permease subunit